ncbi:MAG: DUF4331 family protein [Gemmatimonadaceae bacterium]
MRRQSWMIIATMGLALSAAGCSDDDDNNSVIGPSTDREYTQIERLGNPLVSEVFFLKRDHGLHNTKTPNLDKVTVENGGTGAREKIRSFAAQFGRSAAIQNTLAAVLAPDMLQVYPNRAVGTAGWLTHALQPGVGYGGRKLTDDVVDAGLTAIFGNLLDPTAPVATGLTSDNVGANDKAFLTAFPYLAAPTP